MKAFIIGFSTLCATMILVHSAPFLSTIPCRNPTDLEKTYNDLASDKKLPIQLNDTNNTENASCPVIRKVLCPSYPKLISDETVFPSRRNEVTCLCRDCTNIHDLNECIADYEEKMFLKRIGCSDGFYVYEPKLIIIPVACQCKPMRIVSLSSIKSNEYDI